MKIVSIPARCTFDVKLSRKALNDLPKGKCAVLTSCQHVHKIKDVAEQLKTNLFGQTLGCNVINALNFSKEVDFFLFVGSGMFHPLYVSYKTDKPVFVWNPFNKILTKIDDKDVEKYKKKRKGALLKFYSAKTIGIIVSLKPGQMNLALAEELKNNLEKKSFIFVSDTLNFEDLENFSFVDCWVNTACPRIVDDFPMVNIDELIDAGVFVPEKKSEKTIWRDKRGLEL
jgi:2-(3-amino-3-carboxypropyl)histidine synthase